MSLLPRVTVALEMRSLVVVLACCAAGVQALPHIVAEEPTPIVLWHGMGDTCCLPFSMGAIKKLLEQQIDGVYVRSLMIGKNEQSDQENGFFMPILEQLDYACDVVKQDPRLSDGFHAIGFSQGGLFLRLLVQTCDVKVKSLVSIGGPQQGVYGLPQCTEPAALCKEMDKLLELGAYLPLVQHRLVQAQYWHDPVHHKRYLDGNIVLPLLNNELEDKNVSYAQRLQALEHLVLVKFENDTVVIPRESEWFGFFADGQDQTVQDLEASSLYQDDWLGLRALDTAGRLHLLQCEGNHLQMPPGFFRNTIIPFLTGTAPGPQPQPGNLKPGPGPASRSGAEEAQEEEATLPRSGASGMW